MNTMTTQSESGGDTLWSGDLLHRRGEADLLEAYIESVVEQPRYANRGHTIAVDAGYGEGKTFFLTRLAAQLAAKHPVAFIDAWADDVGDQPLVALAATLKVALEPYLAKPEVKAQWDAFAKKAGKVAQIVGLGVAKKALGLLITQGAVEAVSGVLSDEDLRDATEDAVDDASSEIIDRVAGVLDLELSIEEKVAEFQGAQAAMMEMRASLSAIVRAVRSAGSNSPVIIIVDELDRCRPSYAIKFLEEVKHLFDIPGLVFVLGMHGGQLAHAVKGAYGATFDGVSYLRRFVDRRYFLASPTRIDLVRDQVAARGLDRRSFFVPSRVRIHAEIRQPDLAEIIALYMDEFDVPARDIILALDMLEMATIVAKPYQLILPYILPLIVDRVSGGVDTGGAKFKTDAGFRFVTMNKGEFDPKGLFEAFKNISRLSFDRIRSEINSRDDYISEVLIGSFFSQHQGDNQLALPSNYERLVGAVSRFDRG